MTAIPLLSLEGLSREEWLDARRLGIGSSDAPAIAGVDKFRSPLTVYYDKLGELAEQDETEPMHWGNVLEQVIADEFARRNGYDVRKASAMYRSAEHPFMLANPDRELFDPEGTPAAGGLECKFSNMAGEWAGDDPPTRVLIQVQHQIAVMGWEWAAVAAITSGARLTYRQWIVERDDELIGLLIDLEDAFWESVQERRPPKADGHRSTGDTLAHVYRLAAVGSTVELDERAAALVTELDLADRALADAKADVEAIRNELKALLGTHEVGLVDGEPVVTWKAPKAKERRHNCPDCLHVPDGPPARTFRRVGR